MQPVNSTYSVDPPKVSILTRPVRRMQPPKRCLLMLVDTLRFNPHPPREADATAEVRASPATLRRFNPHPPREADATSNPPFGIHWIRCFNPHPPREADATGQETVSRRAGRIVSILTRPERRMQQPVAKGPRHAVDVSILTRPVRRMQLLVP